MWSILKALRENPEILFESQRRRGESTELVEKAIELDKLWRKKLYELNNLRKERNELSRRIKSEKSEELIRRAKELSRVIKERENEL